MCLINQCIQTTDMIGLEVLPGLLAREQVKPVLSGWPGNPIHDVEFSYGEAKRLESVVGDTQRFRVPVVGQRYSVIVELSEGSDPVVSFDECHQVYLRVTSRTKSLPQLELLTKLDYSRGWSIGEEVRAGGTRKRSFTSFIIDAPSDNFDSVNYQLTSLLDLLDSDEEGVRSLCSAGKAMLYIATWSHASTVRGYVLDSMNLARVGKYGFDVDCARYVRE